MATQINNDLTKKYSNGTMLMHWLTVACIAILIPTGLLMVDSNSEYQKLFLYNLHLSIGIAVFFISLLRVWFFFKTPRPAKLKTGNALHNKLIVAVEYSFYLILLLLPFTGIGIMFTTDLYSTFPTSLPQNMDSGLIRPHKFLSYVLISLFVLHIAGIFMHLIKHKENTLKRILPIKS